MDSSDRHGGQSTPKDQQDRVYFTDPGFTARVGMINRGFMPGGPAERHDNILFDSETGKLSRYYAEDERRDVDETATVVEVHVTAWRELVIFANAPDAIYSIIWLIRHPALEWRKAPRLARDLLATANLGNCHAISVPVGHGRMLWIPSLPPVRGLITVTETRRVRMHWDRSTLGA